MGFTRTVHKLEDKIKRKVMQIPVVDGRLKRSYEQLALLHQQSLPHLTVSEQIVVDQMRYNGVYKTTLKDLGLRGTERFDRLCNQLLSDRGSLVTKGNNMRGISLQKIQQSPEILCLGLEETLLNIVENYVGLPIYFLGGELKKELPNGDSAGVRQWHLDTEDYRMVKIIVYLSDVDLESGPFEYLPQYQSSMLATSLQYKSGFIPDRVLENYVPRDNWYSCVGKKLTAILVDTANTFHRAKPAISRERRSITFHYISQKPLRLRKQYISIHQGMQRIYPNLTERQLSCLVP